MAQRSAKDERREKILESTWKLIARDGIGATNMRALAAEAGYANGALAYYFAGKDDLLLAAYDYVLEQTNVRIAATTRGLRGLSALRAFCAELLPDDELKLLEVRVVLSFWSAALNHEGFAELHQQGMASWRKQMRRYMTQAVALRETAAPTRAGEHSEAIEALLSLLLGMQSLAVLTPEQHTPRMMRALVDNFLGELAAGADDRGLASRPRRAKRVPSAKFS